MASCPKCGKQRVRKQSNGSRICPRCGALPGVGHVNRSAIGSDFGITLAELAETYVPWSENRSVWVLK